MSHNDLEVQAARSALLHELGLAFAARIEIDEIVPLVIEKTCGAFDACPNCCASTAREETAMLSRLNNRLALPHAACQFGCQRTIKVIVKATTPDGRVEDAETKEGPDLEA